MERDILFGWESSMPLALSITKKLEKAGWKIKIRDREKNIESPHATILIKTKCWRYNLRTKKFMDKNPNPKEIPAELIKELEDHYDLLERRPV